MEDAELEKVGQQCCTLIGCFVPPEAPATCTDTGTEGADIAVLTALTRGAGRPSVFNAWAQA